MSADITLPTNPDTLWKILPSSATQLERHLLSVTATDDLRDLFGLISRVKRELEPTNWLPLLLAEYGFSEIAKDFTNWRPLLAVSKDLRGKWGTPYSIEAMAKLMRYLSAEIWEEPEATIHFPEFQLDLAGFEADLTRLGCLRRMVNVVKPVRGRFRRIFNSEWDERQFKWDESEWGDCYDNDSGVDILPLGAFGPYRSDDQFLVSLGIRKSGIVDTDNLVLLSPQLPSGGGNMALVELTFGSLISEEFFPTLDDTGWDDDLTLFLISELLILAPTYAIWVTEDGTIIVDESGSPLLL